MNDAGATTLLERDAEVAMIHSCLHRAAEGSGSTLVVEGADGLGKTALLEVAASLAVQRGFAVLRAAGAQLDQHVGFGVAIDLLESVPRGPDRAHPRTLLTILDGDSGMDAVYALHRRLVELTERAPLLVAVDDAQWADAASLRWLLFAAQRALDTPLAIIVTANRGVPDASDDLLSRLAAEEWAATAVVEPLSATGTATLVDQRLPNASRELAEACATATGGNPFLAGVLLDDLEGRDHDTVDRAPAEVAALTPAAIVATVLGRLEGLGPPAVAAARAMAVLGSHATAGEIAQLADLSVTEAAAAARSLAGAGIVGAGEPWRFHHPLVADAVYTSVSADERSDLHARAARLVARTDVPAQRSGAHLLLVRPRGSADAVKQLRAAAAESISHGTPASAVRFLQRALEEPPPPADLPDVLMELGEAEALTGSDRVVEHLEQALALRADSRARAETLARLGAHLTELGQHTRAREMFARALQEPDLPGPMMATLRTAEYSIALTDGTTAVRHIEPLLDASKTTARGAAGLGSGAALTQLAVAHVFTSRDADAARDLALRGLQEMSADSAASLYASSIALSCLIWCDELEVAEAAIGEALEDARRRGAMMSMAYVSLGRSWTNYLRGRIARAERDASTAVDAWSGGWSMHLPIAAASQALALVELDRAEEAVEVVDRVLASRSRDVDMTGEWLPHHEPLLLHARGRAELALGKPDAAARDLKEVAAQQSPFTHNPAVIPWRSDAAIACALTGDLPTADDFLREETKLAQRFGSPRPIGVALRATALVRGGDEAVTLLRQAVDVLERSPARIELVRALVDLGTLLRARGDRAAAREVLSRAMLVEDTTTAVALRRRAGGAPDTGA